MSAIALRQDFDAVQLRALARSSLDACQVRRLLALAAVYDGAGRGDAAVLGGMDHNAEAPPWVEAVIKARPLLTNEA